MKVKQENIKKLELDCFTGVPLGDDALLEVLPIIAPYRSVHNYKFRVKITPGIFKKGKLI